MTLIELKEHGSPSSWPLDAAVGRALAASRVVAATPDPHLAGHWRLKPGSKVGAVAVNVPGAQPVTVRITPKVPIKRLFFLLGYGLKSKDWRNELVDVAEHTELVPAVAHAFERLLERALRQGLLQGYRVTEEATLVVRGRIREADQIRRRFGTALPAEMTHDEFTTDVAENRLLRAATERLLQLPDLPAGVRRRLLHHRGRLGDVSGLVRGQDLPEWQPTRLNARYHHVLHLARAVLSGNSVEHQAGRLHIDGYLLDMNKLFEDFVTLALREAYTRDGGIGRLQDVLHLDEADQIRMKPDLVLYGIDGRVQAVVDAKYKAGKPKGYPDADLYQMLAYCTALGLPEGHLVYAKGNAPHAAHRVRHAGITLHQHALDLNQPPAALLAEVRALAQRLTAPASA